MQKNNEPQEKRTPQEKLDTQKFILDSSLFLIKAAFIMVSTISVMICYFVISYMYETNAHIVVILISAGIGCTLLVFIYLGFNGIKDHKKRIENLKLIREILKSNKKTKD
ncbi:MAG: hypothetical protein GQ570_13290 [Helicobacteraceae bacterium]|nr:hypothetical protein [Helicobacteraceae bacterium]